MTAIKHDRCNDILRTVSYQANKTHYYIKNWYWCPTCQTWVQLAQVELQEENA